MTVTPTLPRTPGEDPEGEKLGCDVCHPQHPDLAALSAGREKVRRETGRPHLRQHDAADGKGGRPARTEIDLFSVRSPAPRPFAWTLQRRFERPADTDSDHSAAIQIWGLPEGVHVSPDDQRTTIQYNLVDRNP